MQYSGHAVQLPLMLPAGTASIGLTTISGGQHCPSTELAVIWSSLSIEVS